jgi:hypothetical protein
MLCDYFDQLDVAIWPQWGQSPEGLCMSEQSVVKCHKNASSKRLMAVNILAGLKKVNLQSMGTHQMPKKALMCFAQRKKN